MAVFATSLRQAFDAGPWSHKYRRVVAQKQFHDDSDVESEEMEKTAFASPVVWYRRFGVWATLLNVLLFVISISLLYVGPWSTRSRNAAWKAITYHSAALDEIEIPVVQKFMNATLVFTHEPNSIFRRDPSPEVDRAWHSISDTRPFGISKEDVIALDRDPATAVQFDDNFGDASGKYAARLDVLHHIHCLDAVRREAYSDYYFPNKTYTTSKEMHDLHLSHCIYYLLQGIMCSANFETYTHIWTDTLEGPWPDFNINRQCVDFDKLLEWQSERALDQKKFEKMIRPADHPPAAKMVKEFKDIYEVDGPAGTVVG